MLVHEVMLASENGRATTCPTDLLGETLQGGFTDICSVQDMQKPSPEAQGSSCLRRHRDILIVSEFLFLFSLSKEGCVLLGFFYLYFFLLMLW